MATITARSDREPITGGRSHRHRHRRRWLAVLLPLAAALIVHLGTAWREGTDRGGQRPAEPFRIAGNFYYVGANDVAAFLITGPEGHVLIDGGYPRTPELIMASIARLGFDIRDVKVLLNSEPHFDHAGGLAALQEASGAALWASAASADVLASGGVDPDLALPMRAITWAIRYPAPRADRRFEDGDTIRVGPIALAAHVTGGHTRGCTSYSFRVRDGDRLLDVVSACSLVVLRGARYPGYRADLERTFRVLRSLPADVWVTSHARLWGRYRKFVARDTAANAADPFIDPDGYRAYVDSGEARFHRGVVRRSTATPAASGTRSAPPRSAAPCSSSAAPGASGATPCPARRTRTSIGREVTRRSAAAGTRVGTYPRSIAPRVTEPAERAVAPQTRGG